MNSKLVFLLLNCYSIILIPSLLIQSIKCADETTTSSKHVEKEVVLGEPSNTPDLPPHLAPDETTTSKPVGDETSTLAEGDERDTPVETTSSGSIEKLKCMDENYCLNGGTCVLSESGQMLCLCQEEYYGSRCETRNICKMQIVDSLTGDQICAKIDRECFKNDKFFRCSCHDDEYFVFKTIQTTATDANNREKEAANEPSSSVQVDYMPKQSNSYSDYQTIYEQNSQPVRKPGNAKSKTKDNQAGYLAECRAINKCLGVRCRQLSEVCKDGDCVCNQEAGYIRDSVDGLCKLMDPCLMPTLDGNPICGQAQCVATFDSELYRCVCPIGYKTLKVGALRNSTQCALLQDTICDVPLLNKCQHICKVDSASNTYRCECLPGYLPGKRVGYDDHACFFDEHIEPQNEADFPGQERDGSLHDKVTISPREYVYKSYLIPKPQPQNNQTVSDRPLDNTFSYDAHSTPQPDDHASTKTDDPDHYESLKKLKTHDTVIKRELRVISGRDVNDPRVSNLPNDNEVFNGIGMNKLSAQERCNMYCEENKICVLEEGTNDSYRCHCDRQGYVSVGDRCLDWCAAAEFSFSLLVALEMVCWSGACKPMKPKPAFIETSWRPTFECDCTSSPLLVQDPKTRLCKLDFQAVIEPCLPGNIGYIDCVEHKNAYCAVMHKSSWSFRLDLQKERPEPLSGSGSYLNKATPTDSSRAKAKAAATDKLYTCVCSPDKKFLVDKPRNKERCVDECDLLNVECGRFNRMCRAATIAPDDFGHGYLVRMDPDGVRMNFKRTGCECLPGFNVGPSELVDFTLDDNNPSNGAVTPNYNGDLYPPSTKIVYDAENLVDSPDRLRAKYMNINSRCLLDYDVVEFHASFKAPADFDPNWVKIRNAVPVSKPIVMNSVDKRPAIHRQSKLDPIREGSLQDKNQNHYQIDSTGAHSLNSCDINTGNCILNMPNFVRSDISELHRSVVLVSQCYQTLLPLSIEAYQECIRYRYWIVQKLRNHFVDWRRILTTHLSDTFDLMEGNIKLRVNKCEAILKDGPSSLNATSDVRSRAQKRTSQITTAQQASSIETNFIDPFDQLLLIDADIDCELTLHSAGDDSSPRYSRKVLLEKQLQKFIFVKPNYSFHDGYYLMAPNMLIRHESFDQLAEHRKLFNPCKSEYGYCDKQTKCEMVDTVNFTCTCEYGYTPIGSRDIYFADSRKEVCEDINECLFDVCKELANVSTCINEIGDYRCQCNRHYTGDNKRYCTHVCNTIPCKHGKCRLVDDHHAFCECDDGYKEADCSVQDPNVALRKANMIICGSIFASVLLLAITIAISLNSQLKKTKKKLKRIEAASDVHLFEFPHQQPFRPRMSSKVSSGS